MTSHLEQETARLRLRRPRPDDRTAWVALHSDPRTYWHAPHSMPDAEQAAARFDDNTEHWVQHGFGHVIVEEIATDDVVGVAGLKLFASGPHTGELNLYYRLAADAIGRGYGREVSRAVVAASLEDVPQHSVVAFVKPHNLASLATARSAGLEEVGTERHAEDSPDEAPSVLLRAPRFEAATSLDAAVAEELVDLWVRVNDAGGAVGFLPGAARVDVAAALARQVGLLESGLAVAGLLRHPDGALLGCGFWVRGDWWGQAHVLSLGRLMVDPARQGRGTGRLLMAGLHGLARTLPDVELWHLVYRSGLGLGDFYARLGWEEVGRLPLGLRLASDDRRDSVTMVRLPDGGPVVADGRP